MQRVILWALLIFTVVACGIPLGSGTPNDGKPSGSIVASANLQGLAGKTASGAATIYLSGSVYVLRFDGLSVPSENGLQVVVVMQGGQTALQTTLRSNTGNQNYSIPTPIGQFSYVSIYSTAAHTDYARATFPASSS